MADKGECPWTFVHLGREPWQLIALPEPRLESGLLKGRKRGSGEQSVRVTGLGSSGEPALWPGSGTGEG